MGWIRNVAQLQSLGGLFLITGSFHADLRNRINYLHARHGSKITNEDMLFTLCLFIFEPLRLCEEYEWRAPTDLERKARFVWYRELGIRMGITNIPSTREALVIWRDQYQAEKMVYAPSNTLAGEATLELLLRPLPSLLRPSARQAAMVLLPSSVRVAFGWPAAPAYLCTLLPLVLKSRATFIRYCLPPRQQPHPLYSGVMKRSNELQTNEGTFYKREAYLFEPWYTSSSSMNTLWSYLGYQLPSKEYQKEGYRIESVGPKYLEDQGREKTLTLAAKIRDAATLA